MCKECGCGDTNGATRLHFFAKGYDEENSKVIENDLNGLSGVMFVHIHAHDGETVVDYMPGKTKLTEILKVYENHDVDPNL